MDLMVHPGASEGDGCTCQLLLIHPDLSVMALSAAGFTLHAMAMLLPNWAFIGPALGRIEGRCRTINLLSPADNMCTLCPVSIPGKR